MITYTCPRCGKDMEILVLLSMPPQYKASCNNCGWSYIEGEDIYKLLYQTTDSKSYATDSKPYKVGQIVKCGGLDYKITNISSEPYEIFDDGSKHYAMALKLCGGKWDEVLYVNDTQLDKS